MEIFRAYLITFGWAVVGSLSMGVGLIVTLWVFSIFTRDVDEWKLIKEGNVPMSIVLGAVIIACGLVVASAIRP